MKKLLVVGCWLLVASAGNAAVYGTLVGGKLVRAPYASRTDEGTKETATLTEAQANALGYRLVVDEPPACASNEYAVATGWELRVESGALSVETTNSLNSQPTTLNSQPTTLNSQPTTRIYRVYETRTVEPTPRRWTPLAIKRAAAKLGKWQDLKAFLVAADAYDDFCMAQYEAEDDADFVRLMAAARSQLGNAVVDAVLNSAEVEP